MTTIRLVRLMSAPIVASIALSDGSTAKVAAEPVDIARLNGMFVVHERLPEPRQATGVFHGWVVTHTPSGYAVAYGYSRDDAVREAERRVNHIGRAAFLRLALKATLGAKKAARHEARRLLLGTAKGQNDG